MRIANKLVYCFCAIALLSCAGQEKNGNGVEGTSRKHHFLWKVSDENSHVWLFGSVHLADSSFYPLDSVITEAYVESAELGLEADVTDPAILKEIESRTVAEGMYPPGKSLKEVLPDDLVKSLDSLGREWGLPFVAMERMKPWMLELTLETLMYMRSGLNPNFGLDIVFSARAKEDGKKIVSLEGVDDQFKAMPGYGLPDEDGVLLLRRFFHDLPTNDSLTKVLVDAWKNGDDETVGKLSYMDLFECMTQEDCPRERALAQHTVKTMLVDRNVKMAETVEVLLKENRSAFVIVGVAHLVREEGVVSLLKKKGYKVERF